MLRALGGAFFIIGTSAWLGCGGHAAGSAGARDVRLTAADGGALVSQAELQEDLQRFTGQFMDRITQAAAEVSGERADPISDQALRMTLAYEASALDIATEPLPEVALLDMMVFVRLARMALVEHWIPKVYGDRGQPFAVAFEQAEAQLSDIAGKIMTDAQKAKLAALIADWRRANPGQFRVEAVRLGDFSVRAGKVASAREKETYGLLAEMKNATHVADEALLLAQRATFALNRLPFLLRGQLRVGGREILRDGISIITSEDSFAASAKELRPALEQLSSLVSEGNEATREARLLIADLRPIIPTQEAANRIQRALDTANELTTNTNALLREVRASTAEGHDTLARVAKRADESLQRALLYLVLLGAIWTSMFWGGYVIAKRIVRGRASRARRDRQLRRRHGGPATA